MLFKIKESGFIKLGMQLKVSEAGITNLISYQQFENINVDFY